MEEAVQRPGGHQGLLPGGRPAPEEIHRATEELAQATEKADFMMNAINPTVRLVNRLGQMGIAVFAGWQLLSGQLTVGVFQAFFQYVNQSAEPLTEASYVINSMQSALASAERVYRLLDAPEERPNPARCPNGWTGPGGRWSSATCPSATPRTGR